MNLATNLDHFSLEKEDFCKFKLYLFNLMNRIARISSVSLILLIGVFSSLKAQTPAPKLVVGIVVDQMRSDYLDRYWDRFGEKGFKRLIGDGYRYHNAHFPYSPTFTGPGHASVYTGTPPAINGIAGNNWYDRYAAQGVYCAEDTNAHGLGVEGPRGQRSPKNLLTTSISDEIRIRWNYSNKVIGISLKDRGAILPAGHMADAAYWLQNGNWCSSTWYFDALPKWVKAFNKSGKVDDYLNQKWNTLYPIESYTNSAPDDNPGEGVFPGEERPVFPHNLKKIAKTVGPELIKVSPFGNSILFDFAREAVVNEGLGQDASPDVLALSFSAPDILGHKYGPQAIEIEDCYLRLDQELGQFLDYLDEKVGKGQYLVFLTADHGGADVPSWLETKKGPGGYLDEDKDEENLKAFLKKEFGGKVTMAANVEGQFYLDYGDMDQDDQEDVRETVAAFIREWEGIEVSLPSDWLLEQEYTWGPREKIQKGFNYKRSGDIITALQPGYMNYRRTGTTHGSPYAYDTHVPLLFYGWGIKEGESYEPVEIIDIAPTLAAILGTQQPSGCTGIVLRNCMD